MSENKLDSQQAFNLVESRRRAEPSEASEKKSVEEKFGEASARALEVQPTWKKYVILVFTALVAMTIIVGVSTFYWFMINESEPVILQKQATESKPAVISEEQAKQIIEANLRAFLQADSIQERLKYIYMPEDEVEALNNYYGPRQNLETPLWRIDRLELSSSIQGEIWFVVYRDVKKEQHFASFQRYGDDYLLHWSAMTAYGELPWSKFLTERPTEPVMMRGYVRHYQGVIPPFIDSSTLGVFIFEDPDKIMAELMIVAKDTPGYEAIKSLKEGGIHPVTAWLAYEKLQPENENPTLRMVKLKHLRWQRIAADPRLEH